MSLSRLNHWLPRRQAHPEVVQGTADLHHEIADTLLPQADPIFHDAAALGVTGAIKSHSFIIALNINKLSFSAQRWKSLVMRHMTKNCELDSKSEYLTPFSHSDHHHGSRGPLHESRKLSTIGPTESTFASADSRSDSLNM